MRTTPACALALPVLGLCAVVNACGGDDTTPPTVVLRATPCCLVAAPGTSLTIEAEATDDDVVSRVAFFARAPGDPVATRFAEDGEAPFTATYPTGGFVAGDSGVHQLSAEAYDAAGNVGTSSVVTVVVAIDVSAPVVRLTTTVGSRITAARSVPLTATTFEPVTRLELYDGATMIGEVTGPGTIPLTRTFSVPVTRAENGPHVYTARAVDVAGNSGESAPISVTVDISWAWRSEVWGSSFAVIRGLAVDGTAGVYAAGELLTSGVRGAVLARLDAAGAIVWSRNYGDSGSVTRGYSVARDATGGAYLAGEALDSGGESDAFVARYDASGGLVWSRRIDGGAVDQGGFVAVDGQGGVYVAGSTSGALDGNPNQGGSDAFLVKYDRDGSQLWVRQFGSAGGFFQDDDVSGIAVDTDGNVYVVGTTWGDMGGAANAGQRDAFLAKYAGAGDQLWVRLLGTAASDDARGVAVGPGAAVYVTGENRGGFGVPPRGETVDAFVARFEAAGTLVWARQVGTPEWDVGHAVAVDASGVHLVGYTYGRFDDIISQAVDDIFLAHLAPDGTLLDVRIYDAGVAEEGFAAAADGTGAVYVGGFARLTPALVLKHVP